VVFFGAVLFELFALVDALLRPIAAFPAADKLTKSAWVLILVLGLLTSFFFDVSVSMLGVLGLVAAGVYMADVRPALAQVTRRR
jgi:hypothetical protein